MVYVCDASFRVDDAEAAAAQRWAERLELDRSELLRQALHAHLVRLASEADAATWQREPLTARRRRWASWPIGDRPRTGQTGPMRRGEIWFAAAPGGDRPVLVLTGIPSPSASAPSSSPR